MFYFQQLLNTALGGIDATNVIPSVSNMAFAILLIGFLVGLYQAVLRGGDLQALAVTAIKYLVVAMIVAHWSTVFRDVNSSFNTVASFIGNSSGAERNVGFAARDTRSYSPTSIVPSLACS